jgi:hypothetical protein
MAEMPQVYLSQLETTQTFFACTQKPHVAQGCSHGHSSPSPGAGYRLPCHSGRCLFTAKEAQLGRTSPESWVMTTEGKERFISLSPAYPT